MGVVIDFTSGTTKHVQFENGQDQVNDKGAKVERAPRRRTKGQRKDSAKGSRFESHQEGFYFRFHQL